MPPFKRRRSRELGNAGSSLALRLISRSWASVGEAIRRKITSGLLILVFGRVGPQGFYSCIRILYQLQGR